jgi:hypothetical protein
MPKSTKGKQLRDSYRFPGFYPGVMLSGVFGDRHARVIRLTRRSKKRSAGRVGSFGVAGTTASDAEFEICHAGRRASTWSLIFGGSSVGAARA